MLLFFYNQVDILKFYSDCLIDCLNVHSFYKIYSLSLLLLLAKNLKLNLFLSLTLVVG